MLLEAEHLQINMTQQKNPVFIDTTEWSQSMQQSEQNQQVPHRHQATVNET